MYSTFLGRPCGRMLSSPVKWSNPTIILSPLSFFLLATPHCTENSQAPCRSVINGGQPEGLDERRTWVNSLRNQASLLNAEGFSYPSPTIKAPNPKVEAAMAGGPPSWPTDWQSINRETLPNLCESKLVLFPSTLNYIIEVRCLKKKERTALWEVGVWLHC